MVTFLAQSLAMVGLLQWWSLLPNSKHASLYLIEQHCEWLQEDLATLLTLLAEGKIKPVIAQRLPLEQIAYAHKLLETGN